jgi:hypothetical protein
MNHIGSARLRKTVKIRRENLNKVNVVINKDCTETTYDKLNSLKEMHGLYSRWFHKSFFTDMASDQVNQLFE